MLLTWNEIKRFYGEYANIASNDFLEYGERLDRAGKHTYGLLLTSFSKTRFTTSQTFASNYEARKKEDGIHAEEYIVKTLVWETDVAGALEHRKVEHPYITLILNRTPCPSCAKMLVAATDKVRAKFQMERNDGSVTFVLCCLGRYIHTTNTELINLSKAGWKLTVLEMDNWVTTRGKNLLTRCHSIQNKTGYFTYPK
jgi:hypothetical protein